MRPSSIRIRWFVFAFMFAVGFIAYLQQKGLTVAADLMEPELGLTQLQIGWLRTSFILAYALFQFPAGVIGQSLGARQTLVYAGIVAVVAVLMMPAAPLVLSGSALYAAMLVAQFSLGVAQSFVWPVSSGVLSRWFPSQRWAFVLGLQTMGLGLGSMVTPPLISGLMVGFGWQRALAIAALPAIPFLILWAWFGRNTPAEHPKVSPEELAELDAAALGLTGQEHTGSSSPWAGLGKLLTNRTLLLLAFSYLCMNYLFYLLGDWVFLYLRQERHFSILESGWLAGVPPLAGAIGAGFGGFVTSTLCARLGNRWGLRLLPLLSLPVAGLLLLVAVSTSNPLVAVAALTAAYGAVELNEGAYWAAAMNVGGRDTMSASGLLNTGGNLGGVVTAPIVGYLSGLGQWDSVFSVGAAFAAVAAGAWLLVNGEPTRQSTGR